MFAVEKVTVCDDPLHITMLAGRLTCPSGFTVILNDFDGPGQLVPPFENDGVTVMVEVIGAVPGLAEVKDMLPVPLAASPVVVLLFVQLYVVVPPVFTVENATDTVEFLHTILLTG